MTTKETENLNESTTSLLSTEGTGNQDTGTVDETRLILEAELLHEKELDVSDGGAAKLPPVVTTTGEEDENVIYRQRSKIYRFDEGENKWKERGIGEARILEHKVDKNHFRFILRREGTLKLGANHFLLKTMTIKPNVGVKKAWVWNTPADSSDEEVQPELFALKFPDQGAADAFHEVFTSCVKKSLL